MLFKAAAKCRGIANSKDLNLISSKVSDFSANLKANI
jgi:hypothetical protein